MTITSDRGAEQMFTARVAKAKKIADTCVNWVVPALDVAGIAALDTSQRRLLETMAQVKPASDATWDLVLEFITYHVAGVARGRVAAGEDS